MGSSFKFREFPCLHAKGLHDAVARDGLVKNVLDIRKLVLTATSRASDTMPDFPSRENDEWDEQKQQPREFLPLHNHHGNRENEGEQLLEGLS